MKILNLKKIKLNKIKILIFFLKLLIKIYKLIFQICLCKNLWKSSSCVTQWKISIWYFTLYLTDKSPDFAAKNEIKAVINLCFNMINKIDINTSLV